MHRFLADEAGIVGGEARLDPADSRHASQVLRLTPGEEIGLVWDGGLYAARLTSVAPQETRCLILHPLPSPEPRLSVTLYQALPKGDKMDWIVQKCTELGVHRIVPVAVSRCVVKLDQKDGLKKQERWQRIAREAAKQSGRAIVPEISAPVDFKRFAALFADHQAALIPWEDARQLSLSKIHTQRPELTDAGILIGPEGGLSPQEIETLPFAAPVTLGPRILRTETAGMAALAALYTLWGDME